MTLAQSLKAPRSKSASTILKDFAPNMLLEGAVISVRIVEAGRHLCSNAPHNNNQPSPRLIHGRLLSTPHSSDNSDTYRNHHASFHGDSFRAR
ncbi:MAG: hypothetical protein ACI96M_002704, partial [Candidatus Azotimanducaceae bacterium]